MNGERSLGFFTERGEGPFDVCELCVDRAGRFGLRARPSSPDELTRRRRRASSGLLRGMFRHRGFGRRKNPSIVASAVGAAAIPVALATFNESEHARTLAGLFRTLGAPRACVTPRSPTDREVVLTVAWEIVWYQFRVLPDGAIELARGAYVNELPARWREWNCTVLSSGRIALDPSAPGQVHAPNTLNTVMSPEGAPLS